ncbi:uncharacterized protein A4U43_C06F2480 [Asparagus officinalis]|uniref:Uncharacterized protein n=1 Tax=Asparagus officinalis TaxID=4686 RepID=A0A5P1EJK0_ASPOF|nr:cytochrome P450 93A3-like [Asparagus officinalis]ONK65933.1 uncharacterized protein A4U43_C06F2480 [Asparagus officinalis]
MKASTAAIEVIKSNDAALFLLLWIFSFIVLRALFGRWRRRGLRLPPGPLGLPIIGHLHLLGPIAHQALHKLSLRYGPVFFIRLGSLPCVVASSAEAAKEFLKTNDLCFSDRPPIKASAYLTYGAADFASAPNGPYWRFMRKLCMTNLLGGRTLEQLLPVRRQEISSLLRTLFEKSGKGEEVHMGEELLRLTNNVICRMAMGQACSGSHLEPADVQKIVGEATEIVGKFNLADYVGFCKNLDLQGFDKRLEDLHRRFDKMMEGVMKDKEETRKLETGTDQDRPKDLLDILLDIADDDGADMRPTRENIKAFIMDIFVAGTDTSALTLEWAMAQLINHPAILQKARDEIYSVVGTNRLVNETDIPNLPYLQAVVKETLRLYPSVSMVLRQSTEDSRINGYDIPARTRVFVNLWAVGRDPNHWSEPLEFRPERFAENGQKGVDVRGQHFHLLPFGSGRRICPGASLALQVIQPMLAAMIQCFDWKVDTDQGMVDMREAPGLTIARAQPLVCRPVALLQQVPLA